MRAKAIESTRTGASGHPDHSPQEFPFWTILLRGRYPAARAGLSQDDLAAVLEIEPAELLKMPVRPTQRGKQR